MKAALLALTVATLSAAQTTVFSWTGTAPNDWLGSSLTGPGDLDGDGIPDIVIGSASPNNQPTTDGSVVARSGADGSIIWQSLGQPLERLGTALAPAGDVTRDGINDLVVSAPGGRGVVLLSGANGSVIRSMPDVSREVDGGYDFNGDSVPDQLAVYTAALGGVKVYSGVDGSVLLNINPNSPYVFTGNGGGFTGKFLKDTDGDGFDDVVAARDISGVTVRFRGPIGAPGGAVTAPGLWGEAVSDVGNVTGDDRDDVAVSWLLFANPLTNYLRVYNSATGTLVWEIVGGGGYPGLQVWGRATARLSDIDGDGRPEIVSTSSVLPVLGMAITATGATIISGGTGIPIASVFTPVPLSGGSIATIGDVTGDGVPEFAFGYSTSGGYVGIVSPVTLTAASVLDLGGACGAFATTLASGLPAIGSTLTVTIANAQPSASALLVVDQASDLPTALNPCGVLHLDLAHLAQWIQIPLAVGGTGAASFSYFVPTTPALEGAPFTAQAAVFGTPSPLGFDLSNGLRGTIGY